MKFFRPQCAHLNNEGRWSTFRLPVSHCQHWMTVVNPCQGAQQSGRFVGPYLDCPTIPGLPCDMSKAFWHAGKDAHSSIFEHNSVTTKRLHCDLVIYLMPPFLRDLCPCVVFKRYPTNECLDVCSITRISLGILERRVSKHQPTELTFPYNCCILSI